MLGADAVKGKTWVFYKDNPEEGGGGPLWWFMSAPNSPSTAMGAWWNAGATCCPPPDANGKMHFDLDGDANYTHYETAASTGTKGLFTLDVAGKRLIISDGAKMLGSAAGNADGVYTIISLTEDKMVLYLNNNEANGTGWTFVFKPE